MINALGTAVLVSTTAPNTGTGIPADSPAICLVKTGASTSVYEKTGAAPTAWTLISGGGGGGAPAFPLSIVTPGDEDTITLATGVITVIDGRNLASLDALTVIIPAATGLASGTVCGLVLTNLDPGVTSVNKLQGLPINFTAPNFVPVMMQLTGADTLNGYVIPVGLHFTGTALGSFVLLSTDGVASWFTVASSGFGPNTQLSNVNVISVAQAVGGWFGNPTLLILNPNTEGISVGSIQSAAVPGTILNVFNSGGAGGFNMFLNNLTPASSGFATINTIEGGFFLHARAGVTLIMEFNDVTGENEWFVIGTTGATI